MEKLKEEYQALLKGKDDIESKIAELNEILASNADIGMEESLVDTEGYPRSDIDVYSVRHARHDIICLQNDHKEIMNKLEEKLYKIHEVARENKQQITNGTDKLTIADKPVQKPFLTVNQIAPGGPADLAGLKSGDLVKEFGSVSSNNFNSLQDVAQVVLHSKDKVVKLLIDRNGAEYRLEIIPRVWGGRGLLGCNVVELKT